MTDSINKLEQRNADDLREHIDETRSSIAQKLETLEEQVRGTVETARETIQDTVSTVKHSVEDTVETVKQTFDINMQVQRHPLPMVGGALLVGFACGRILASSGSPSRYQPSVASDVSAPVRFSRSGGDGSSPQAASAPKRPGIMDHFSEEIQEVKGVVIGYAVAALRDLLKDAFPNLTQHIDNMSTSVTTKLGGQPVRERIIDGAVGSS